MQHSARAQQPHKLYTELEEVVCSVCFYISFYRMIIIEFNDRTNFAFDTNARVNSDIERWHVPELSTDK